MTKVFGWVAGMMVFAWVCGGCVPAEPRETRTAEAIERLAEAQARLGEALERKSPVVRVPPPDLGPLLQELRKLRDPHAGYTGAVVHVDARESRCVPCRLLKRDLEQLARNTRWTVGFGDDSHWKLVPHDPPAFPVPRIDFLIDGRVVGTCEGYPNQPTRSGYFGPIDSLIEKHPMRERDER